MLVPVIVEMIAGLVVVWAAIRGWGGRLSRNGGVGVRTPSTMRSDAAFETANKAAAPLAGAGGAALAICGVLGAVFTLTLILMARSPTTFGIAMLGENIFQFLGFIARIDVDENSTNLRCRQLSDQPLSIIG